MAATFCELQLVAIAESLNGDETCSPAEGLLTVTLATAGSVTERESDNMSDKTLRFFMIFLCDPGGFV
jgi:hypothetical protein